MSRSYISLWYLLPPGQHQELPEHADDVARKMFHAHGKGDIDLSSRSGYVDYALGEFARLVNLGGLRRILDPDLTGGKQFRVETYRGAEAQELSSALKSLLDWARANPTLVCEALSDDPQDEVRDALGSDLVERGSLADHPAIPFAAEGQGPHVLFTYLRSVRALAERAGAEGAMLLQLKSRG